LRVEAVAFEAEIQIVRFENPRTLTVGVDVNCIALWPAFDSKVPLIVFANFQGWRVAVGAEADANDTATASYHPKTFFCILCCPFRLLTQTELFCQRLRGR